MDVDANLNIVGDFGRVQNINFLIFGLCLSVASLQTNSIAFTIDQSVEHYCKPPAGFTPNETTPFINKDGRQIPDSCHMYSVVNGTLTENTTECQYGWEYPNERGTTSALTDLDLVCSRSLLGSLLMSVHFAGFLVGCSVTGQAADMFGRRTVSMVTLVLICLLGTTVSFIWNFELMLVVRFVLGVAIPGNTLVPFIRVMEMCTPKNRLRGNLFIQYFWTFGLMMVAPVAYLLPRWRHLQLAVSLCCLPLLPLHWFFSYESIRWLVQKGRLGKAKAILQKIAKSKNIQHEGIFLLPQGNEGVPKIEADESVTDGGPTDHADSFTPGAGEVVSKKGVKKYTFLDLFKTRILIKYILIMFICWFVMNAVYFGLFVYSTSLAGNKYLNFFLLAVIEAPVYIIDFFIVQRFGRRNPLIYFFFGSAVACFLTGLLPVKTANGTDLTALIVVVAMIGKFHSSAAYDVTLLVGVELFPTVLRNIATGTSATVGKTSTIIAPFIVLLKGVLDFLPMTIFGILSLLASACVFLLPETKDRPLPEAYDDVTKSARHRENARP